ncbi:MAG: adenylosuccinate lyase [Myxococcales bacterium]|nr:MAG: adenylosuccinate lyase [Myxococcales bacterium]
MIPRYTPADFDELWQPLAKYQAWFDVELAACRAMENAKLVPKGTAVSLANLRDKIKPERIDEIETSTRHDVIAFLTHIEELGGSPARWLHRGMTSSDVLDSSLALLMVKACDALIKRSEDFLKALRVRIEEHRHTPMIGRSHGIHAEPLTFGLCLAGHYSEIYRACERLRSARKEIAVGKIAGAVGSYSHLTPSIEKEALAALGLAPETVSTQVVARDRHASFFSAMALMAAAIERLATNVRHWQRTEVAEAEEAFSKGQKGSSAMPHKRNPIASENLCGLARIVRAAVTPALENIALWHERDISHSSVERMLLPDATTTLAFMLDRVNRMMANLVVYPEHLKQNLDRTGSLWASEGLLLRLVEQGLPRQEGYVLVQRNAMRAFSGEASFKDLILQDKDIRSKLSETDIEAQFDLQHVLSHVDTIIDRALEQTPS